MLTLDGENLEKALEISGCDRLVLLTDLINVPQNEKIVCLPAKEKVKYEGEEYKHLRNDITAINENVAIVTDRGRHIRQRKMTLRICQAGITATTMSLSQVRKWRSMLTMHI
jgi:hypothetical protein